MSSPAASPKILEGYPTGDWPVEKVIREALYVKESYITIASFVALLFVVSIISTLSSWLATRKRPVVEKSAEPHTSGSRSRVSLRRLPSAALNAFRIVAFRWTIPVGRRAVMTLSEFSVVAGYMSALLVWNFINSYDLNIHVWEDRAGNLAAAQLSFVVALAGKNNIVSFFTGVSHEKLNIVHRWTGRTIVVLGWIHAFARNETGLVGFFSLTNDWLRSGLLSLVALSLAAVISLRFIRNRWYEFFLLSHIVLILIGIIGAYFHRPIENYFFYPPLVVWGFDRVLRLARLIGVNKVWRGTKAVSCQAKVELLSPDTVRLSFRRNMMWKAGQHIYVILPSVSNLPFEAHPFSIASIPEPLDGGAVPAEKEVACLIRGRDGFTRRLRDHANKHGVGHVTAMLDGPYGYPPEIQSYSSVILVAGGSGVSFTLPLLLSTVSKVQSGHSLVRRVVFIWVVRDEIHLKWINHLLVAAVNAAPADLVIEARIHVTGVRVSIMTLRDSADNLSQGASEDSKSVEEKKEEDEAVSVGVKTENGRPDIHAILKEELEIAEGAVSVNVAGPSTLAQSVRSGLGPSVAGPIKILKGAPSVHLHVETFGVVAG